MENTWGHKPHRIAVIYPPSPAKFNSQCACLMWAINLDLASPIAEKSQDSERESASPQRSPLLSSSSWGSPATAPRRRGWWASVWKERNGTSEGWWHQPSPTPAQTQHYLVCTPACLIPSLRLFIKRQTAGSLRSVLTACSYTLYLSTQDPFITLNREHMQWFDHLMLLN